MGNTSAFLAIVFLFTMSFSASMSVVPVYTEGDEINQQTLARALDQWTWLIMIFVAAILAGAFLLFWLAIFRRRRKKHSTSGKAVAIRFVR
jgi:hypothetical protein